MMKLLAIPKAVGRFFSFLWGKVLGVVRQVLRFFLFPFSRRRGDGPWKTKPSLFWAIVLWSEKGEPEDPQEKEILFRHRWYTLATFLWISAMVALMLLVFGNPVPRAWCSIRYVADSWTYIFKYLFLNQEDAPAPTMSNEASPDYSWVLSTIRSFWFYFQAGVGGMANGHVAREWFVETSNRLIDFVKVATWIPIVIVIAKILASVLVSPHPGDDGRKTAALRMWDDRIVPRVIRPVVETAKDYGRWCSARSAAIKRTVWILAAALCIFGWTVLDFATSYFVMLMTFSFGWFPAFGASVVVDAINFLARIGLPGIVVIAVRWIYRSQTRAGLMELRSMQANNEAIASSLPVVTAVNGPVGVGKTTMVSSVAVDAESYFRDYYLSVQMKYSAAFPKFDWDKLEDWVRAKCDPSAGKGRLETRAKIKEGLKALWDGWIDSGLGFSLENGNEAFFGYDADFGLDYFDGAKRISIIDAVMAYAESYFMYFSGRKLVTSNYPIAMDSGGYGEFFPIYNPASAYLAGGCKPPKGSKSFSTIFNEDFFRIKTAVDPNDTSKDASIDGGVIAMTEGSNERGNRFDYSGMSRKDKSANKVNDGWNQAMRLIRHWFMVDGKPVVNFIYDYQRGDAMNADQKDAAEDTILIMQRGEEQNALPCWWFLDYITEWFQAKWNNYYWYSWKANRRKRTLLNRILGRICGHFINLRQRLRYSYGYEVAVFNREHGGGNGLTGQRSTEQYFFIYRKVRGELFNSGVYAPILEQRSISAKSGWLDMPTFSSVEATPEEFELENSFFMQDISSLFDSRAAGKASDRIKRNAAEGTELPDGEEAEAEPAEKPQKPEESQQNPPEKPPEGDGGETPK